MNLSMSGALNQQCDCALHLNPRFGGTPLVARNSYLGAAWGEEETWAEGPYSVYPGQHFNCHIVFNAEGYKVVLLRIFKTTK